MTIARQVSSGDLEFFDALRTSADLWVQRAEEGRTIAAHIEASRSPILVLYGPPRSGNTELIQRWVLPLLAQRSRVVYRNPGDVAPDDWDAREPLIEILDGFESYLVGGPVSAQVLRRLGQATTNGNSSRKFVLVVQEDYLSRLFYLRETVPHIVDDVFEVPEIPGTGFQDVLVRVSGQYGIQLADSFRSALIEDLNAVRARGTPTPDLVAILAFELCRLDVFNRELSKEDYRSVGGLVGILRAHLDLLFENLPDNIDAAMGWAVVREVLSTPPGRTTDMTDVANRFDVSVSVPTQVLRWLEEDRHILRSNPEHGHDLVPGLLALAVEASKQRDEEATEHQRWLLRQGVRLYAEVDALLSEVNFRRIHQQRSLLLPSEEETRLMARSALSYKDPQFADALDHWLRRVSDREARADILLEATFDARAEVRERAVARLRDVDRPEVKVQLQLLALRDPSPGVRAAAVDSMAASKDEALKTSLRQEVADPNSPYRVEATEALRVFPDRDTIATLLRIIGGQDQSADVPLRKKAIEVLGHHNTRDSVEALMDVALRDADEEDRAAAADALARVSSIGAASCTIESLRAARREAWRLRPSWSAKAIMLGVACVIAATAAIAINIVIYGFILATLRKWRGAIAMTAAQVVLVVLARSVSDSLWMLWGAQALSVLALALGFLAPTRMLLLERQREVHQGRYRRWLGVVLFAFGCVTTFAAVHGLPLMMTRRIRRGLVLVGFEVGAWIILSNLYFFNQLSLGGDNTMLSVARHAPWLLTVTGVSILVLTYVIGVGTVFSELFIFRKTRRALTRIDDIWKKLLQNSQAQQVVLQRFAAQETIDRKWGLRLVKRYKNAMQAQVKSLWADADAAARRRIFTTIASKPNADSLDFLKETRRTLGLRGRIRYVLVLWSYRLSLWPKPVLLVMPLAVLVLGLYVAVLHEFAAKNPVLLLKRVQEGDAAAAKMLGSLARSDQRHVSAMAATSLQLALDHGDVRARSDVLEGILGALPPGAGPTELEQTLASILTAPSIDTKIRSLAITALKQMSTAQAALKLRDFVQTRAVPPFGRSQDSEAAPIDPTVSEALTALAGMQNAGTAPLRALLSIRTSFALPRRVREAADVISRSSVDPLLWSDHYLQEADYDKAIRAAQRARPRSGDFLYERRVANALGRAHYLRGLIAINKADSERAPANRRYIDDATNDFWAALNASPDDPVVRVGTVTLAERIVFQLHETVRDPKAFEESYRILSKAQPLTGPLYNASRISLEANLAEAALTAGHFDEAHRWALNVSAAAMAGSGENYSEMILNMKLIAFVALLLQRNEASKQALDEVLRLYDSMPSGFENQWVYTGTLQYIRTGSFPDADKRLVENTIARIMKRR